MDQDRPGFTPPPAGTDARRPPVPPETRRPRCSRPRSAARIGTGVLVAAVGIAALGVAGTTYAAPAARPRRRPPARSPRPHRARTAAAGRPGRPGRRRRPPAATWAARAWAAAWACAAPAWLHGTFVVPKEGGGYQTMQMQHGIVTAVSATSISVKSEDGFTATYVVNADTEGQPRRRDRRLDQGRRRRHGDRASWTAATSPRCRSWTARASGRHAAPRSAGPKPSASATTERVDRLTRPVQRSDTPVALPRPGGAGTSGRGRVRRPAAGPRRPGRGRPRSSGSATASAPTPRSPSATPGRPAAWRRSRTTGSTATPRAG